jgi:outer membrane protein assembly factor BamB
MPPRETGSPLTYHKPVAAVALAVLISLGGSLVRPAGAQRWRTQFVPTFEYNNRIKGQLTKLDTLEHRKLWEEWINNYQALVDNNPDGVMPWEKDDLAFLDGLRYRLHAVMGRLPAFVKAHYRAKFDHAARLLFDQALATGNGAQMRDVYERYRYASYAPRALTWIADRALDDGDPEVARIAYSRLVAAGSAPAITWLKFALAAQGAGRPAEAKAALQHLVKDVSLDTVRLGGERTTAANAAQELLAKATVARSPRSLWPNFAGPASDRRMSGSASRAWRKSWEYTYPVPPAGQRNPDRLTDAITRRYPSPGRYIGFLTFPVVDRDRVYVQGPYGVAALALSDGKPLRGAWERASEEMPSPSRSFRGRVFRRPSLPQDAPALEDGLLALRIAPFGGGFGAGNLLSVRDARTGKELWRRRPDVSHEGARPGVYFNLPALHDNTLYTGVASGSAGITEYRAVALGAGTGDPVWSTYLGGGSDSVVSVDGSPPMVRDGLVWIESSLHTLNALDIVTGEIRTIYRYLPRTQSPFNRMAEAMPPNDPISLIPGTGPIVFSSRWGDQVVAIDSASCRLLWSALKGGATALAGVDAKSAYLCGSSEAAAFELTTGLKRWARQSPGTIFGTGCAALVGDRLCWLVDGKMYALDPATGEIVSTIDLTATLGDSERYTSTLFVGPRLLVGTRERLIAFEPGG